MRPCRSPVLLRTGVLLSLCIALALRLPSPWSWCLQPRANAMAVRGFQAKSGLLRKRRTQVLQRLSLLRRAARGGDYAEDVSGWSPAEEKAVMDDVLGRGLPEDEEEMDLLTETRQLREQT